VVVNNIKEFISAVSKSNSYVVLSPSLAGKTLWVDNTIYINGENITIDGSDAPGAIFKPSKSFGSNKVMMYAKKKNIIVNEITLEGGFFPDKKYNNVGGIRFSNSGIWVNKVTVS
jgi:hypothetical protein